MLKEEYMIATKATEAIEQAVCYELQNIVKKYGATYNSEHEAYAVLKEEVEEAVDAVNELDQKLSDIWLCIKNNLAISETLMFEATEQAKGLAEEAVQCAAVLERFLSTVGGKENAGNKKE